MKNKTIIYISTVILIVLAACNPTPEIDDSMLDSGTISYAISDSLKNHLVSEYIANPTETQKNTPVIIAAHGYTATTFEWNELRAYADSAKTFYVSQVLLGGHGRSYEAFKAATWRDWQSSIIEEYIQLSNKGFKKIYFAGSSTGAPLIIQLLKSDLFSKYTNPKGIFMIDPIVVSANKQLTMVGLLGPILGYTTVELANGEIGKWYVYRPYQTLKQLMELIDITRKDLQKGILVTDDMYIKVFKSRIDDVADPVSAVLISNGIKFQYKKMDVEMVDSKIHVFTRLDGRPDITAKDRSLQHKTFKEIESKIRN